MSKQLLQAYIRMAVAEAHLARVPNQLVSDNGEEGSEDAGQEDVNEFSGAGAGGGLQGFTAPLGMDPNSLGRKKNKPKRK
jgi:hypothetical protein